MTMPTFTMRQLLEAGVHFGHHIRRWNPKMKPYIFGVRNGVHILDLQQTVPALDRGLKGMRDIVANGGRVLFVSTKRTAQDKIKESAKRCGQYYVNYRWLGGMLTNWKTISRSINRLRELEDKLGGNMGGFTKKELMMMSHERDKLELSIGGIKEMGGIPDALFIIDTNKEDIAVSEARKLGIPVFGIVDTNCDPSIISFPIPGNDDALRAIELYCDLVADAVLDGLAAERTSAGKDKTSRGGRGPKAEEVKAEEAPATEQAQQEEVMKKAAQA